MGYIWASPVSHAHQWSTAEILRCAPVSPSCLCRCHPRCQSCRPALLSGFIRDCFHAARCHCLRYGDCRFCPPYPLCPPNCRKPQASKGKKKGRLLRLTCCPHPALGIGNRPARYTAYPPTAYHWSMVSTLRLSVFWKLPQA